MGDFGRTLRLWLWKGRDFKWGKGWAAFEVGQGSSTEISLKVWRKDLQEHKGTGSRNEA